MLFRLFITVVVVNETKIRIQSKFVVNRRPKSVHFRVSSILRGTATEIQVCIQDERSYYRLCKTFKRVTCDAGIYDSNFECLVCWMRRAIIQAQYRPSGKLFAKCQQFTIFLHIILLIFDFSRFLLLFFSIDFCLIKFFVPNRWNEV